MRLVPVRLGPVTMFLLVAQVLHAAPFDVAGRATAFALVASDNNDAGVDAYKAVIAADGRFAFDRINEAIGLLKKGENQEALKLLDEAAKIEPSHSQVSYLRGLACKRLRQYKEALAAFAEALKAAPDCREAHFQMGLVHEYENRGAEAAAEFRKLLEFSADGARRHSIAHGQAMYLGYKHLSLLAMADGKDAEAEKLTDEAQKYGGNNPPQEQSLDIGPCGAMVDFDAPAAVKELAKAGVTPGACKTPELKLTPVNWAGPGKVSPLSIVPVTWTTSGLTGYWCGADALVKGESGFKPGASPGQGRPLASGDINGDGREDVVVATEAGGVEVRPFPGGGFAPVALAGVTGVTAALAVDHDHDGDLDILVAGMMGDKPGIWNFQNTTKPGKGSEGPVLGLTSTEQCGLTTGMPGDVMGLAAGDIDEGNDTDIVAFVKDHAPIAFLSHRQGKFARVEIKGPSGTGPGVLADLDGDGLLDIAYPTATGFALLVGRGDGTFLDAREVPIPGGLRTLQAADLDGDGRLDLVGVGDEQVLNVMIATAEPGFAPPIPQYKEKTGLYPMLADVDGDGGVDIVCTGGRTLMNQSAKDAGFVRVTLSATAGLANGRGVGSRLWVRAGGRLMRREVRHAAELFNLGGCTQADLLRVQWTNGVLQHCLRDKGNAKTTVIESGMNMDLAQPAGLSGSCPYLYVDRGRGPEYLTDVLAGAPLGLPGPDGRPVPCSPREVVGVPRAAWAAVGGAYRFRVTEEYREVTYLDQVRLHVFDHPAGTVALADGGIGAPADAPAVLQVDRLEPVTRAVDGAGRDVTRLLARADGEHLEPPRGPVQGLAPEHALELTLPAAPEGSAQWLVLTGFVFWTDAGLNTRLAQVDPQLCAPPRLEVPDGKGGWRVALPFVRFPAGRSKTALVDLTGALNPNDRRVRLVTSMRIYLDQVALASAASVAAARDAGRGARVLGARTATVLHHGIAPLRPGPETPPWTVDAASRRGSLDGSWLVPAGLYTRYGPAEELLADFDDRYVVMGPGDGVDVVFDAPPGPAAGMERDLFIECAGWDKDAHPATLASSTVEPLPYRGMPAYGTGDRAKLDAVRKGMAKWSTRWRQGFGGTQP